MIDSVARSCQIKIVKQAAMTLVVSYLLHGRLFFISSRSVWVLQGCCDVLFLVYLTTPIDDDDAYVGDLLRLEICREEGCSESVDGLNVVRWRCFNMQFPSFRWDPDTWREEPGYI